ncbi:hypothetical protein CDAR_495451 [Caerostris darwini]|uniref:Uncharacterized protein n=1 Tax=Caerostris darwini TaxID=1538125 RepID=A0AAV4SAJ7_9ARAC|nr:hypothetical protein CDAR_495451 [Caerostris darwini]
MAAPLKVCIRAVPVVKLHKTVFSRIEKFKMAEEVQRLKRDDHRPLLQMKKFQQVSGELSSKWQQHLLRHSVMVLPMKSSTVSSAFMKSVGKKALCRTLAQH